MSARRLLPLVLLAFACTAHAQSAGSLRDRYPATSIDSIEKADAALAATASEKGLVEQQFKDAARACLGTVLVNDCLDRVRAERRQRVADIDSIELEANRFKRRDRSDRLEQSRRQRDAERAAGAPADAAMRERNRRAYEQKQADAARNAADRAKSDAGRTAKRKSAPARPGDPAAKQAERDKNAAEFHKKTQDASEHQKEIERRLAQKAADRKRRDEAKAAKDAKTAAAINAAAAARSPAAPKP